MVLGAATYQMAAQKRESPLGKERRSSLSLTATTKLMPNPKNPIKTNSSPPSLGQAPTNRRPVARATPADVSKPPVKNPAPRPVIARATATKPVDKPLPPTPKKCVPTSATLRPSSLSRKTVDSDKPVPGTSSKTTSRDIFGKRCLLHPTNARNVKRSGIGIKTKEIGCGLPARKEKAVTFIPHGKVETRRASSVRGAKTHALGEKSSYIAQDEVKPMLANDDFVLDDQEPLDIETDEAEIGHTDAKTVVSEQSTDIDIRRPDSVNKSACTQVLRQETKRYSKEESHVDHSHDEAGEGEAAKEIEEAAAKEPETTSSKKAKTKNGSEARGAEEMERHTGAVEMKRESENVEALRACGKKESALSNDVIEETASKLREQRKNRVRALAGAFETVISLQEK